MLLHARHRLIHEPGPRARRLLPQSQFGIARADSQQKIIAREARWTSLVGNASKILWVNGDLDPWHARSNLAPPAADQPVIWPVEGASHCAWMAPASEADQQSVQHARAAIYKQLSEWLRKG